MPIQETDVTLAIIEAFQKKLRSHVSVDVAIVGAGPSGLAAAHFLRKESDLRVAIFERKLSPGGGLWGGGMGYNVAVFEKAAREITEELGIRAESWREDYLVGDSVQAAAALVCSAIDSGVPIFNLHSVEDVTVREHAVTGVVIQSTGIQMSGLHVDPLCIAARCVVDATGHEAAVVNIAHRKGLAIETASGHVVGESSMWAEKGEQQVVQMAGPVYPGLYACGMAACAVSGGQRMGAIFGGMLESAKRCAGLVIENLA